MSEETKEAQEVAELFSTAIEASGVQWCGGGCLALPPEAHRSGVASGQTLHLAAVPTTREELFSALVLIGRMVAVPDGGKGVPIVERQSLAEAWAAEKMHDADLAVPRGGSADEPTPKPKPRKKSTAKKRT